MSPLIMFLILCSARQTRMPTAPPPAPLRLSLPATATCRTTAQTRSSVQDPAAPPSSHFWTWLTGRGTNIPFWPPDSLNRFQNYTLHTFFFKHLQFTVNVRSLYYHRCWYCPCHTWIKMVHHSMTFAPLWAVTVESGFSLLAHFSRYFNWSTFILDYCFQTVNGVKNFRHLKPAPTH